MLLRCAIAPRIALRAQILRPIKGSLFDADKGSLLNAD